MIKEETYGIIWGTVFLVIGLIILLVVFASVLDVAQNPSEKLEQWVPEENIAPTAAFQWWSEGNTVEFNDASTKGSLEISSWNWDFGNGETSSEQHPNYTYLVITNYTVTLKVTDAEGNSHIARNRVSLIDGESNQGQTPISMSLDLGLSVTLNRIAIAIIFAVAYAILVMIGGRFLVAGCRLLKPNIQFYRMKMEPKDFDKKETKKEK